MHINFKMTTSLKMSVACCVVFFLLYLTYSSGLSNKCEQKSDGIDCTNQKEEESVVKYSQMQNNADVKEKFIPSEDAGLQKETSVEQELTLHLSVVACGDRLEETLTMIKSAVLFTRKPMHVHIFADDNLQPEFIKRLQALPASVRERLTYTVRPIQFPADQNADEWRKLFKPCASQRLFIPDLINDVDALLYVDTDILFLRPVEDVWKFFDEFNSKQIAAMAPEHEEPTASWYKRFARHPYVPPYGINSGVMLMNLTRMRSVHWLDSIIPYYKQYRYDITWGDQDLINIYFHFYPERLYQFSCDWNYRPDHCMYMSNCKQAEDKGVSVLHGCRSVFHNEKQPVFKAVYQAIHDYQFDDDLKTHLLEKVTRNIKAADYSVCGNVGHIFTKQLEHHVAR